MYSYRRFNDTPAAITQINNAYNGAKPERKNISVLPEIRSMSAIVPDNVSHNHSNGTLSWNNSSDAKFYYLFRSTKTLTYSDEEIFKVVDKNTLNYYTADTNNTYNYGVKVLSGTNHLSGQSVDDPVNTTYSITYNLNGGSFSGYNTKQEIATAFLTDFYNFVNPTDTLNTFIHGSGNTSGFNGSWYNNDNYRNTLYQINVQENNNAFFLSHTSYQTKWKPLADFMVAFVAINPNQSFWASRSTGIQRLWQYFTNVKPSNSWSDEIMSSVPSGLNQTVLYTYNRNSETITLPQVEKQNNTFLGWYTTSNFQGSSIANIPKGSTGNKVLYAKWEDNTPAVYYDVIFNLGYNGQTLKTDSVKAGDSVNRPNNPQRSGYTFLGWYYNGSLFDFANKINNNVTLTALWQEIDVQPEYVTVNFSLGYNNLTLTPQTIEKNSKIVKPTNPTRPGYTFNGWFFNNSIYDFNSLVNSDITLTANWILEDEKHYLNVTFDYNYDNLKTTMSVEENTKVIKPINPTRENYEFLGWNFAGNLFDFSSNITYDIVLIAQWKQINTDIEYIEVTFIYGYDDKKLLTSVVRGNTITKPEDPNRAGYIFNGWYFAGSLFDFNLEVNKDITLIAMWEEVIEPIKELTTTFKLGYDNKIYKETEIIKNEKIEMPFTPYREGYTFIGWYLNEQKYDFTLTVTESITLTAKWEEIKELKDVSIYGKTSIRINKDTFKKGIVFYGVKNKDYQNEEHGFYLIFGRTTNSELSNAINNNLFINDKKVLKVVVNGLLENNTFCVVITGIPEDSYGDVITVVPYTLIAGEIVLSKEAKISSVNHTIEQNTNITLNFEMPLYFKKRKTFY